MISYFGTKKKICFSPCGLASGLDTKSVIIIAFFGNWQIDSSVCFFYWRCITISAKNYLINEEIKCKEVRLSEADGTQLGIVPIEEALQMSIDRNIDLVLIAPQAKPPVCKLMDYGKFVFEQNKKDKEVRKNQKVTSIKEVKLSPSIEEHDISYKQKNARKFLSGGDKVKVSIRFRGREMSYTSLGEKVMTDFMADLEDVGTMERKPKLEGRNMIMIIAPKTEAEKKSAKKKKEAES